MDWWDCIWLLKKLSTAQFPTFCRPSRTVCRFLFRISSLDSYFILRSGTTAIRLKRMSWYGSLKKSRAAEWELSPKLERARYSDTTWAIWCVTHPAVASPILSIITRRALSVHSSSSPQGPRGNVIIFMISLWLIFSGGILRTKSLVLFCVDFRSRFFYFLSWIKKIRNFWDWILCYFYFIIESHHGQWGKPWVHQAQRGGLWWAHSSQSGTLPWSALHWCHSVSPVGVWAPVSMETWK